MPFTKERLKARAIQSHQEERRQAMAKANNAVYDGATVAIGVSGVSRIDVAEILERCARELRAASKTGEPESGLERDRR